MHQLSLAVNDQGLKEFRVKKLCSTNTLQSWPLYQLACKAIKCESIEISHLERTTHENREALIEMTVQFC